MELKKKYQKIILKALKDYRQTCVDDGNYDEAHRTKLLIERLIQRRKVLNSFVAKLSSLFGLFIYVVAVYFCMTIFTRLELFLMSSTIYGLVLVLLPSIVVSFFDVLVLK